MLANILQNIYIISKVHKTILALVGYLICLLSKLILNVT